MLGPQVSGGMRPVGQPSVIYFLLPEKGQADGTVTFVNRTCMLLSPGSCIVAFGTGENILKVSKIEAS